LCELTTCRRQALLSYFGESSAEPCGNCDTCLEAPETWDATEAAQKGLSCVHRTGQRFGVTYLVNVLLGKDDERIKRFGHDRLSTFGVGKDLGQQEWRGVFRQLVGRGLLAVDLEGHGGLKLTDACRPVLRGERRLMLRRDQVTKSSSAKRPANRYPTTGNGRTVAKKPAGADALAGEADATLWQALRAGRLEIARSQGVPPYVVFHDATLAAMVERRPQTLGELAQISGVGDRKLAAYGEYFLGVILAHADGAGEEK
jgi:ATP-dependent DNA helicase RecQ